MSGPQRIRLSRAKGWRLPEGAVNVARPGPWGNPFIVGQHGTRAECVALFACLIGIGVVVSLDVDAEAQRAVRNRVWSGIGPLVGRDLACWCALDGPCHADVLLAMANEERRDGLLDRFLVPA